MRYYIVRPRRSGCGGCCGCLLVFLLLNVVLTIVFSMIERH